MEKYDAQKLKERLFETDLDKTNIFLLLDPCQSESIYQEITLDKEIDYRVLLPSNEVAISEDVLPYLVDITNQSELKNWFLTKGYGNSWGLVLHSQYSIGALRDYLSSHFHQIIEKLSDDSVPQTGFIAFYDPRVFPGYFDALKIAGGAEFFGYINKLFVEDVLFPKELKFYTGIADGDTLELLDYNIRVSKA